MKARDIRYRVHLFKDGTDWCAVLSDFRNLQESPAGFGLSPSMACVGLFHEIEETSELELMEQLCHDSYLPKQ